MAHLQTDGARVFSLWHNEGLIGYHKRPRDPAQLAKLMIDFASGDVEDLEPSTEEGGKNQRQKSRGVLAVKSEPRVLRRRNAPKLPEKPPQLGGEKLRLLEVRKSPHSTFVQNFIFRKARRRQSRSR
jgi:hypothetical protein